MKTLYLVRHGSAEAKMENRDDAMRKLTPTGKLEIKSLGKKMRNAAEYPDRIISSPATRAVETAQIIAKKIEYPARIIENQEVLFKADSIKPLLELINTLPADLNSVCLVGHNPLLTELAKALCKSFVTDLPKGGIIGLELPIDSWMQVREEIARVKFFDFLNARKNMRTQIGEKLTLEIYEDLSVFFSHRHEESLKHMKPYIMKAAEKLADKYSEVVNKKTGKIRKNKKWAREDL